MILVDTSIWVQFLGRKPHDFPGELLLRCATCGPILQEILQGLRTGPAAQEFRGALMALPRLGDPVELHNFLEAAEIYSHGRRKGFTIHSSTDCLIAAIAIKNKVPVWHRDRDFETISKFTNLETLSASRLLN